MSIHNEKWRTAMSAMATENYENPENPDITTVKTWKRGMSSVKLKAEKKATTTLTEAIDALKPMPKFTKVNMSIAEFVNDLLPDTDCNPIGQRPPISSDTDNEKSRGIVDSIMKNYDIGLITLVDVKDVDKTPYKWESVDGGHRKRSIRDFLNNLVKWNGRYYSQLSKAEQNHFKSYPLSFTLYENMPAYIIGDIFRTTNKTTDVNDQETLNSYGDHPVANAIRETVRMVASSNGKATVIHDLFEVSVGGRFRWISGDNLRLRQEEFVARIYYSFYEKGNNATLGSRTSKQIAHLYNDPSVNIKQLKKKVDKCLDFLFEMAKVRKQTVGDGLGNSEKNALLNLYLYLSDSYNSDLECNDYVSWYKAFSVVYNDLSRDPKGIWSEVPDLDFESKDSTISQLFKDYCRNHDNKDKLTQSVIWMTQHEKWSLVNEYTLFKDRNRSFPKWMKEVKLQEQGYVCAIDGLPLDWKDAEAGHIIAHVKGGPTVYDNLAMIRKSHNRDMGTMDVNEYLEHYNKTKAA